MIGRVAIWQWIIAAAILFHLSTGCKAPQFSDRVDEIIRLPEGYGDVVLADDAAASVCIDFGIPELEQLVRRAFSSNLTLRAAWARVAQADAIARQTGAGLWPQLDLNGSASRTKFSRETFAMGSFGNGASGAGGMGGFIPPELGKSEVTSYSLSLAAAYEVDVWRRLGNAQAAARLDAQAVEADAAAVAITIGAQVAELWVGLVAQREKIALLEKQRELSERYLDLTVMRLRQGQATALDANQQQQQVESFEGQLALARLIEAQTSHQLNVLLGRSIQDPLPVSAVELPSLPPFPNPGVPSELLRQRPDVRAEWLRLLAQDKRIASAIADRFPKLRFSASLFFQERELARLVDEVLWTVAGGISQPLLDGGRRGAEVARVKASAEEQLYRYGQTLLRALMEVQDALAAEARHSEWLESLRKQRDSAEQALDLARERYQRGALDYLRVLSALQSMQDIQVRLIDARRQRFSDRIQLCRSLGGNWLEARDGRAEAL